jgi:hypothetical protein
MTEYSAKLQEAEQMIEKLQHENLRQRQEVKMGSYLVLSFVPQNKVLGLGRKFCTRVGRFVHS